MEEYMVCSSSQQYKFGILDGGWPRIALQQTSTSGGENINVRSICATMPENSCTKDKAQRDFVRNYWKLPEENEFRIHKEILAPHPLVKPSKSEYGLTLLFLLDSWHLRNNVIHVNGKASIKTSADFLNNYAYEL
jgi:hypothetical protein